MKTTLRWPSLALLCSLTACGQGVETSQIDLTSDKTYGPSWEDYLSRATVTEDGSTYYVAEWDLMFETEAALRKHYDIYVVGEQSKLVVYQQISTGYEPTYATADALDIVYCVSNNFADKSAAISDVAAATGDWQLVANVHFRYDPSQDAACDQNNGSIDFALVPMHIFGTDACAANKMLWASEGGCRLGGGVNNAFGVLGIDYSKLPGTGSDAGLTAVGLLRHELGHMLGFRHEHPWAPDQGGCTETQTDEAADTTGRQLTEYDQLSVMGYSYCGGIPFSDHIISYLDGVGARSIYGMPASWYVPIVALLD